MRQTTFIMMLVIANFSMGQSIQSRIAKEHGLDQSLNHALIGLVNNRLFSFSEGKDQMHIDVYDSDSLNLLYHEQIELFEKDKYHFQIEGVYRVKDQFKLVTTGFSKSSNQFGVFIYTIQKDGKLSPLFQKTLFSDKIATNLSVLRRVETNSENSLLFVHLAFVDDYLNSVHHHVVVYDQKLTSLFKLDHAPFYLSTVREKQGLSYHVGNNHLYELKQESHYNKSIKKFQTVLRLKKYDFKGAEKIYTQAVNLPDGFMLSDMRLNEMEGGVQLVASYLGTSKKSIIGIRGVYVAKFNSDLSVNFTQANAFSGDTKAKSLIGYDNAYELDVPQLYGLESQLTDSKGNTYLLYERTSGNASSGMEESYYGSIIAAKINSQGVMEWDRFIAKSQFFQTGPAGIPMFLPNVSIALVFSIRFSKDSRQYLSFKPIMKEDELYLIYNDNPENDGKTAAQARTKMTNISQSVPFAIHLAPTGNVSYHILKNLKIGSENQRLVYSVLSGTTLYTLRDSGKAEVLQRIVFE